MRLNGLSMRDAAQQAFAFLVNQAAYIETQVYRVQYPELQYSQLVPVDTSAPEWIKTVTFYSVDQVGQAAWFTGEGMDIPHADINRQMFESAVKMAAIGYGYQMEELAHAQQLGINLTADKGAAARRAAEEFIDGVLLQGSAVTNMEGLINHSAVTASAVPDNAAVGTDTTWANKTPDEVLFDLNTALTGIYTSTLQIERADTVLLPITQYISLGTRRIDPTSETTLLQWILRNNVNTIESGTPPLIRGVRGLETAGSGATARMVVYRRSPEVLKAHIPMPFRFLPVWQIGPIQWEVPGIFRLGGLDIRRPKAIRYYDGI